MLSWFCAAALAADGSGDLVYDGTREITASLPVQHVATPPLVRAPPMARENPYPWIVPLSYTVDTARRATVHVEMATREEARGFRIYQGVPTLPVHGGCASVFQPEVGTTVLTRAEVVRRWEVQLEELHIDCIAEHTRPEWPDVFDAIPADHSVAGLLQTIPGLQVTDTGMWAGGGQVAVRIDGIERLR